MHKRLMSIAGIAALLAVVGTAGAQGYEVSVSGATLFEAFFQTQGSTNDFIDANNNGVSGFNNGSPDQLAPDHTVQGSNPWWHVYYRGVGSGNGLKEMVRSNLERINGTVPHPVGIYTGEGDPAIHNRVDVTDLNGNGVAGDGPDMLLDGQTHIDIGVMDVPTKWFNTASGVPTAAKGPVFAAKPTQTGYGDNPMTSTHGQANTLKNLEWNGDSLNTNTDDPDNRTVFDTEIAAVPIAYIVNQGTGLGTNDSKGYGQNNGNVKVTELQALFTTGRMPNGENLVACTRDSGSGTRNGAMNTIGVDPSWGRGDNMFEKTKHTPYTAVGPDHQNTNWGSSTRMEKTTKNTRLAVGYTGLMGNSKAIHEHEKGWYEIANIMNDHLGGDTYVRPTRDAVLQRSTDEDEWYRIMGLETMATVGDPFDDSKAAMSNPHAADYIRNIVESIANFEAFQGTDVNNFGMPGQVLATEFVLPAALQAKPNQADPTDFQALAQNTDLRDWLFRWNSWLAENPGTDTWNSPDSSNDRLKGWGEGGSAHGVKGPWYGLVPVRDDGHEFIDVDGNILTQDTPIKKRNALAGDFNYDGIRNSDDIAEMLNAEAQGAAWADSANTNPGTDGYACLELLGDFDTDGDFDAEDVRYFADGLAIDPSTGMLDRAGAFTAIDNAAKGNYFGTALATGKTYEAGDARGDIAGDAPIGANPDKADAQDAHQKWGVAPGAAPYGADNVVDADDIDYLNYVRNGGYVPAGYDGFVTLNDGLDFADDSEAVFTDLSCDMNGDFVVDKTDADILVGDILGTGYGDADLNRKVELADFTALINGWGSDAGWVAGDFNGDGDVNLTDFTALINGWGDHSKSAPKMSPVPEPATLSLLGLGGLALIRRRRCK